MATLQLEMTEPIVQWYTNATHEQKQHITQVITDILILLSNHTNKPAKNPTPQLAFKPFNAIEMKGTGPTASEMVIQDRNRGE